MQADKIVCVSERQADIIIDQVPELKDKIVAIYNPIPPELLNTKPLNKEMGASHTLLYVGGDNYIKAFMSFYKPLTYWNAEVLGQILYSRTNIHLKAWRF